MAAYFLGRADGHTMEHVKLMKLMYLADRECMDQYWFPISYDEYYSMKMGPVLSMTLDLMSNNEGAEAQADWGEWVSTKKGNNVSLQKDGVSEGDLNEIADEEMAVMNKVFDAFGSWTMRALIDYTHNELEEYEEVSGGRLEIPLKRIYEALGKPAGEIDTTLRCLGCAKPNTASSPPTTAAAMLSRLANFHAVPPPHPGAYAEKIDAILNAR